VADLQDLREVELRGVPAADAVVGAKVALALEVVGRRTVPLRKVPKMTQNTEKMPGCAKNVKKCRK
jgi:hypothetical protein